MKTILLTSAGSLVGRGVLDALSGRRENLRIVGGDADPSGPTVQECDEQFVLPQTESAEFLPAVESLAHRVGADLVIPCRDPDALFLAQANEDPESRIVVPGPSFELVRMTRDKWLTYLWCSDRGIPFAPTICTDVATSADVDEFVAKWGFPLIAKPRAGSASLGVRVVLDQAQLGRTLEQPGYIVQPFIDPPSTAALSLDLNDGLPLFWEIPVQATPAVTVVIGPNGTAMRPLCFTADQRLGRVEGVNRIADEAFQAFADTLSDQLASAGWLGPLSVPLRHDATGWHIIELNPRFSGGTSGRLHLGFDEVAWVLNAWLGENTVPAWTGTPTTRVDRILSDFPRMPSSP
ncbi:carbamoyl-phosphate synthase large subunit [Aeromicrobium panaciterrae]|uniref:Carbamoyl-phosphate synthase large subunit n=1 Tax=Aeromicrobium panaciterrae TaxID=363861 RepID=A0ABU1UMM6_9ACTN|nr:ATP-grasp domain-containing protein [Aeromicrobium panaciterrae]MDR7086404.1 carbamoyl-phosphate synthase large subunit [Aeromicrobium panaciterrae]